MNNTYGQIYQPFPLFQHKQGSPTIKKKKKNKEKLQHKTLRYRTLVKYRAPGDKGWGKDETGERREGWEGA